MSGRPIAVEKEIRQLLKMADAPLDKGARSWLIDALAGARTSRETAKGRPRPADHNEPLADVGRAASRLTKVIQRLDRHPHAAVAFWNSLPALPAGPHRAAWEEDSWQELHPRKLAINLDKPTVLSTLRNIALAARAGRDRRQGRLGDAVKQHVVDLALAFFVRFSPLKASGTPTGPFAKFARTFYAVALR